LTLDLDDLELGTLYLDSDVDVTHQVLDDEQHETSKTDAGAPKDLASHPADTNITDVSDRIKSEQGEVAQTLINDHQAPTYGLRNKEKVNYNLSRPYTKRVAAAPASSSTKTVEDVVSIDTK